MRYRKNIKYQDLGDPSLLISNEQVNQFAELLKGIPKNKRIALIMHRNPDPDALAVALAITTYATQCGIESNFIGAGSVSHPMNKTFINKLGIEVKDENFYCKNKRSFGLIIFCDTQKNHSSIKKIKPDIIIDHHPEEIIMDNCLSIIKKTGAASTLAFMLLKKLNVSINPQLATALLIGINTDTKNLAKADETTNCDQIAHKELLSICDYPLFSYISNGHEIPRDFLKAMGIVTDNCFDNGIAVICAGEIACGQKDVCGMIADLVIREPSTRVVVVFAIENQERIVASVRTDSDMVDANKFCQEIFENNTLTDTGRSSAGARRGSGGAEVPLSNREREMLRIADPEEKKVLLGVNLKRYKDKIKNLLL